jgi:hypothetical protein
LEHGRRRSFSSKHSSLWACLWAPRL